MHSLKVLEFDAIRARLTKHCETPLGASWASDLEPSFREDDVWKALRLTGEAHEALARFHVPSLGAVRDFRQALIRASKGGVLGGQEICGIGDALGAIRNLRSFLIQRRSDATASLEPGLTSYADALTEHPKLESLISDSLDGDGTVKDSASPPLALIRQKKKSTTTRIQERIQSYTSGRTRELLSDPIYTVRDGRYVIPLKSENRGKIRGIVHDTSASGQTVFIEPEDVLQLGNALRELESREREEELRVLTVLSAKVGAVADDAIRGIETASQVDLLMAKGRLGYEMKAALPEKEGQFRIQVHAGRHPLLGGDSVVPLDIALGKGSSVLITGPNTGGKTVAIKTVGLFVLMAQSGLMLPAISVKFGPFSQVWADIGDEQSIQQSLSTFSAHIKNIGESLKFLKNGALVLLDEAGAGTDPAEGAALAKAILLEMARKGATILASTHYGELKAFAYQTEGFTNAAMEFDSKSLRPTYRLLLGSPGASHALKIAERYGIPKEVVEAAKEHLGSQAQELTDMFEKLESSQRQARLAQSEADRRSAEFKKAEEAASRKLAEAEELKRTASAKANQVIEAALREIRLEAARLFEELKNNPSDGKTQERIRKDLKDLQSIGEEFAGDLAPRRAQSKEAVQGLTKGMTVRVSGFSQPGTLLEDPTGKSAVVQIGAIKMTVPVRDLEKSKKEADRPRTNISLQKAMITKNEIHLRNMRAEDAFQELERFVDDAVLAGLPSVRIVHGKGEGILRKLTQEYLRKNSNIAKVRDGEPAEGGAGVTIATFR